MERRIALDEAKNRRVDLARVWPLLALILILVQSACSQSAQLKGTDLGASPAPEFRLHDQDGTMLTLADLHGKVIALTFLYTHCPDECPLVAEHLRATADQLGNSMNRVAFVAVSVDPARDTPASVQTFLENHHLAGMIHYLTGTQDELKPVWSAYYIDAQPDNSAPGVVGHSTRIVVIDKSGKQRVNLDPDFEPAELAYDLQALVNEP